MGFPLQPILNAQFFEQLQHIGVGSEEDVKTGFVPVSVFIFPGGHFAPQNISSFQNYGSMTGIYQVFCTG
jgi:hypothetical protein